MRKIGCHVKMNIQNAERHDDIEAVIRIADAAGGFDKPCTKKGETVLHAIDKPEMLKKVIAHIKSNAPGTDLSAKGSFQCVWTSPLKKALEEKRYDKAMTLMEAGAIPEDREGINSVFGSFTAFSLTSEMNEKKLECLRTFLSLIPRPEKKDHHGIWGFIKNALINHDWDCAGLMLGYAKDVSSEWNPLQKDRIVSDDLIKIFDATRHIFPGLLECGFRKTLEQVPVSQGRNLFEFYLSRCRIPPLIDMIGQGFSIPSDAWDVVSLPRRTIPFPSSPMRTDYPCSVFSGTEISPSLPTFRAGWIFARYLQLSSSRWSDWGSMSPRKTVSGTRWWSSRQENPRTATRHTSDCCPLRKTGLWQTGTCRGQDWKPQGVTCYNLRNAPDTESKEKQHGEEESPHRTYQRTDHRRRNRELHGFQG